MSVTEAVHSTKAVDEMRLRVDIAVVKKSIKRQEIIVRWIDLKSQLADVFTKQTGSKQSDFNKNSEMWAVVELVLM